MADVLDGTIQHFRESFLSESVHFPEIRQPLSVQFFYILKVV